MCTICGIDGTSNDPCICEWEAAKDGAYRRGVETRESDGDYVRDSPLSGEWVGDWTPKALSDEFGITDPDLINELCNSFESGYFSS